MVDCNGMIDGPTARRPRRGFTTSFVSWFAALGLGSHRDMHSLANTHDTDDLLRRLGTVRPDSVRRWGRMTVHEMICHVADALRVALGERVTRPHGNALTHALLRWIALDMPFAWPHGIPTRPELDPRRGGTPPGVFAADRAQVEALIQRVRAADAPLGTQPHPVLGALTRAEWLRWAWRHTDHHLRQFGA